MTAPSPSRLAVISTGPLTLSFLSSGEVMLAIPEGGEAPDAGETPRAGSFPLTRTFFHIQRFSRAQIEKSSTKKAQWLETAQLPIGRKRDDSFPHRRAGDVRRAHGSPQRARSTEHLHLPRGFCAPQASRLAVVARQGFQCDDLARPQGLLRAPAVSGAAR